MKFLAKVIVTVLVIVVPASATAGDRFFFVTGQEATVQVVDPGTATCIGGIATGDPFYPCIDSHRIFLRHQVVKTVVTSSSGEGAGFLAGIATVTIDCNLDGGLRGNCWGTFQWAVDSESMWAGTVNGTFDYSTFVMAYTLVGNGCGGSVDGMQLHYDVLYDGGWDFTGAFEARIHGTHE